MNKILISLLTLLPLTAILSCGKKRQINEAQEIAHQSYLADFASQEMQFMGAEASISAEKVDKYESNGINITHDTVGNEVKITLDYGKENRTCNDGKNRRGKVFISYQKNGYHAIGNTLSFSTREFYVNDNKIDGKRVVSHPSEDKWTIEASATITFNKDRGVATWKTSRIRTQTEGQNTPNFLFDDKFEITGTSSGITAQGRGYDIQITAPLVVLFGCTNVSAGVLSIESKGLKEPALVDFGNGECDDKATITYRRKSKQLNL